MRAKRKRKDIDTPAIAPSAKRQHRDTKSRSSATIPTLHPIDSSPFLANPQGADRQREVDLYNALGSEDTSERLEAANVIITGLLGGDGVEEIVLQKHLEKLPRGLATGRQGSRLGRSVVLTELLSELFGVKNLAARKYSSLTFDRVLGMIVAKTKPEGDLSGQETKDHHLGLLFGLQCFVKAKILFTSDGRWGIILHELLRLAGKKPWIREQCGYVIVEALAQMDKCHAEYTLEMLYDAGLAASPEGVGIWVIARNRFLESDLRLPPKPWGPSGNPLDHLETLAKSLKESSSTKEADRKQATQTGSWNSKLHFAWDIVLTQYAQKRTSEGGKSDFENFWKVAVDESLFSSSASPERKFWGFLLFQKLFQEHATYKPLLPSTFSRNLVLCLINQLQSEDRLLHRQAEKSLKVLVQAAEADPSIVVQALPHLISGNGTYNFDIVTKTKTIEKFLSLVDESNRSSVIDILLKPALSINGPDAMKQADMRRQLFVDYMLSMIRRVSVQDESRNISWIGKTALPTIANVAYCEDDRFQPAISSKIRAISRDRLMSCLAHLLSDLQGYTFPCDLAKTLRPSAVKMDAQIAETKDTALAIMSKLLKKAKKAKTQDQSPLQALGLLYALVVLQLYNGEPEAVSTIDELGLCYDKFIRHKDKEDSKIEASELLVELLLSFVSRPSALLRKVAQHVFSAFVSAITAEGLKLVTDVLAAKENLRGQQEMFDQEPENGEDIEDESDDKLDSDVEVFDMNGAEGQLTSQPSEDGAGSEDEDSGKEDASDEEEGNDAKELEDALAQALGTHRLDQIVDEESDSDADMTDSEMMALDSKLVEIFSQMKKKHTPKQERKDATETMVNFKGRVLDLLEIFVKKQPGNPLAFEILLPLLQLIRTTRTKRLADRSWGVIQKLQQATKKSGKTAGEVDVEKQINMMKDIHLEAKKTHSNMFTTAVSTSSLILATSCFRASKESLTAMDRVYSISRIAMVEEKCRMSVKFFDDWNHWCQSHARS